jgi:hypothetical protein
MLIITCNHPDSLWCARFTVFFALFATVVVLIEEGCMNRILHRCSSHLRQPRVQVLSRRPLHRPPNSEKRCSLSRRTRMQGDRKPRC